MPPPPPPNPLPTSLALLTNLLNTLSTLDPSPGTTTSSIDPSPTSATAPLAPTKSLLLTLHALFPTTLLPALDVLDRRLVTRMIYAPSPSPSPSSCARQHEAAVEGQGRNLAVVGAAEQPSVAGLGKRGAEGRVAYYVRSSARQREGRSRYGSRGDGGGMCYEVRTRGWGCSCAAFAFAAFNATSGGGEGGGCGRYDDYGAQGNGDEMLLDTDEGGEDGLERLEDGGEWRWGGLMAGEDVPLCKHLFACILAEHWSVVGGMVEEREVGKEEMAGWAAGWGG